MVDFSYLYRGLCGMSRAHLANEMTGHLGAALVAGYFYGEDHLSLDEAVHHGIEKELDRVVKGEESWFDEEKANVTVAQLFEPQPESEPAPGKVDSIAEALDQNIEKLRSSGHNVIFASIALRALKDHPNYATPEIVDGIRELILGFNTTGGGRAYFGKEVGWKEAYKIDTKTLDIPTYETYEDMAKAILDAITAKAKEHRRGFGGLWHVINHAAALVELGRLGYRDLSLKGLPAQRLHLALWKSLPALDDELGAPTLTEDYPWQPEYWAHPDALKRDSALLTHRVKTLYGYSTVKTLVKDAQKIRDADSALRYLM